MPGVVIPTLTSTCYYYNQWNTKILLEEARVRQFPNNIYIYGADFPEAIDDSPETAPFREATLLEVLSHIRPKSGIHLISYAESNGHFCGVIVDARSETKQAYYHNPTGYGLGENACEPYYPTYQVFKTWLNADSNNRLTLVNKPVQQDSVHCGTYTIQFLLSGADSLLQNQTSDPSNWTKQRSHNELFAMRKEHGKLLQASFKPGYGLEENPLESPVNIAPQLMPVSATDADQVLNILLDQAETAKTATEKQAAEARVEQAIDLLVNQQQTVAQVASLFKLKLPNMDGPYPSALVSA